jgi:hypothetical protein
MGRESYLQWAIENTRTVWWHDSAEPSELEKGLERGAVGVTTNPFLSHLAVSKNKRSPRRSPPGVPRTANSRSLREKPNG